jgi:outer membrane protein assembly factor BamD
MEATAGFPVLSPNSLPGSAPDAPPLMTRLSATTRVFVILALVACLSGCKTWHKMFGDDKEEITETLPVEEMYSEAKSAMDANNFERSARFFQRLVARFPYGAYSEQSQLELAYVLYKLGKPEDATSAIDRFIRTFPRHPHIDYAYYLKAVINFDRNVSFLNKIFRTEPAARDLNAPTTSFNDFNEVLRRYPNSRYADDARQRMVYLRNELARHEMIVGLYYFRRGAYVSSANRARFLLENYPQSEHQGDAVALLAASYKGLGQEQLAADARRVLEANNPEHPYLRGKWPRFEGFLGKLNPFGGSR